MTEDWKGEHLIRKRPTPEQRKITNCSVVSSTVAERKRRQGKGTSQSEHVWAKQFRGFWKVGGPLCRK